MAFVFVLKYYLSPGDKIHGQFNVPHYCQHVSLYSRSNEQWFYSDGFGSKQIQKNSAPVDKGIVTFP